jgi:hypothetical protein
MKKYILGVILLNVFLLQGCQTVQQKDDGVLTKKQISHAQHTDRIGEVLEIKLNETDKIAFSVQRVKSGVNSNISKLQKRIASNKEQITSIKNTNIHLNSKLNQYKTVKNDLYHLNNNLNIVTEKLVNDIKVNKKDAKRLDNFSNITKKKIDSKVPLLAIPDRKKYADSLRTKTGVNIVLKKIKKIDKQKQRR